MRLRGSVVPFIEDIYHTLGQPRDQWLEGLRRGSERLFDGIVDASLVWEFAFDRKYRFHTKGLSAEQPFRSSYYVSRTLYPRHLWRRGHLNGPVQTLLASLGGDATQPAYRALNALGVWEMAGSVGADPCGQGVVLAFFRRQTGELSSPVRHALERVAAHLARAVRLRNRPRTAEDAVVAPDGTVLHAERDARERASREALREAARRIDKARLAQASSSEALELWNALVEGRWSLVERFESDGRRILVAMRNDPTTHETKALTEGELKVMALLGIGHPQKLIAYDLGLSEASISTLATRAMHKLGVRSRAELVELQGALASAGDEEGERW